MSHQHSINFPNLTDTVLEPWIEQAHRPRTAVSVLGVVAVLAGAAQLAAGPTGVRWWGVVVAFLLGVVCLTAARKHVLELVPWAMFVAIVYLMAASAGLLVATRQHLLWESLIALLVAVITGAVGILVLIDVGRRTKVVERLDGLRIGSIVGAGSVMVVWGMLDGNRLLTFEGFVVGGVGLVAGLVWIRTKCDQSGALVVAGGLGLLQAVVLLQGTRALNLALTTGLVLWVLGITVFKLALRGWIGKSQQRASVATTVAVVGLVVGGVAVFAGASRSNAVALVGGGTLLIAGLSAFGIAVVWTEVPRRVVTGAIVAGGVSVLLGFLSMWSALREPGIALLVGFVFVLVGTFFVLRGEGLVAMMLAALVVLWGMGDRTSPMESDPNPTAGSRILALGDSFISGEGAEVYFAGTNQVGGSRNECRRAPTAYPNLVAAELEMGLDSFACSGATTRDLLSVGQMPNSPSEVAGALPQLANLDQFSESQIGAIDAVVVSIGGNDVGFATIVQACLLPRDCDERKEEWFANVDQLGPQLVTTYEAIRERVPETPIIAMPYPEVTGAEACGLGLQDAEHRFVVDFIRRLNAQIRQAAAATSVRYFDGGVYAFAEHGLCSEQPATNHLDLSPPEGHWLARYSPGSWVHGSMHPNEFGHCLTAAELVPSLRKVVGEAAGRLVPPREQYDCFDGVSKLVLTSAADRVGRVGPRSAAESTATGVSYDAEPSAALVPDATQEQLQEANAAQMALTDNEWISQELFRTAGKLFVPSVALMVGAILVAAGLVMMRPRLMPALSPLAPEPVRASTKESAVAPDAEAGLELT